MFFARDAQSANFTLDPTPRHTMTPRTMRVAARYTARYVRTHSSTKSTDGDRRVVVARATRRRGVVRNAFPNGDEKVNPSNDQPPKIDASASAYEILNIRPTASKDEIKRKFLSLSKRYHPDVRSVVDGSMEAINAAYEKLTNEDARAEYDAELAKQRRESRKRNKFSDGATTVYEGLVGPIVSDIRASLDVCEGDECELGVAERMVDNIRQWARTLAFTSELPLPLPLSVDDIADGARLAFMRYSIDEGLREAGALLIEVEEEATGTRVVVRRSFAVSSGAAKQEIPGEGRVMTSFLEEFNYLIGDGGEQTESALYGEEEEPRGLGGIGSAIAAFALPGLPLFGATKSAPGGAYKAYNLKQNAKHIE